MNEWTFIAGIFSRLAHGITDKQQQAALKMLNKLLHEVSVLKPNTRLNGGISVHNPIKSTDPYIVQVTCDCLEEKERNSWYNDLAQADEAMFSNALLQKFGVEVQFLPVFPS